MGQFQHNLGA